MGALSSGRTAAPSILLRLLTLAPCRSRRGKVGPPTQSIYCLSRPMLSPPPAPSAPPSATSAVGYLGAASTDMDVPSLIELRALSIVQSMGGGHLPPSAVVLHFVLVSVTTTGM